MKDELWGTVVDVIDGDTFDMEVEYEGDQNEHEYSTTERVRIEGFDAPELYETGGERSKRELERCLEDREIHVTVHARDTYGRLIADVELRED